MNIWLKISEGIDEIEPLGILDDVLTIVNIKCGYKRDEFCESPVCQTLFSSSNFLVIQSIGLYIKQGASILKIRTCNQVAKITIFLVINLNPPGTELWA